jgi:hypothetical protein
MLTAGKWRVMRDDQHDRKAVMDRILGNRGGQHFGQVDYGMRLDVHHVADAKEGVASRRRPGSDQSKVSGHVAPAVRKYFPRLKL